MGMMKNVAVARSAGNTLRSNHALRCSTDCLQKGPSNVAHRQFPSQLDLNEVECSQKSGPISNLPSPLKVDLGPELAKPSALAAAFLEISAELMDMSSTAHEDTIHQVSSHSSQSIDMEQVVEALKSLYMDQLKPYGRILHKRLAERTSAASADLKSLKEACANYSRLLVQDEIDDGSDWSVLLVGEQPCFIDVYSAEDLYSLELWDAVSDYFEGLPDEQMALPGGRYSCAQELAGRKLQFLEKYSLGQICHIVQLAISQKKILGYKRGSVVPYARSQTKLKAQHAESKQPWRKVDADPSCGTVVANWPATVADWTAVRKGLLEIFSEPSGRVDSVPLANVKRLFRTRFDLDLSETALGHSKLWEMLQDPRLNDICTVRLKGRGYFVFPQQTQVVD